jgi:type IV secretion system protein VirB2
MLNLRKKIFAVLITIFTGFSTFMPTQVYAAEIAKAEDAMCNAYGIFNGTLGKTFAVFAIVALGIAFFLGKVSWGTAIAIALGIGSIFGAPALVNTLTGGSGVICASSTPAA